VYWKILDIYQLLNSGIKMRFSLKKEDKKEKERERKKRKKR